MLLMGLCLEDIIQFVVCVKKGVTMKSSQCFEARQLFGSQVLLSANQEAVKLLQLGMSHGAFYFLAGNSVSI